VAWLICSAVFILIGVSIATQPLHEAGVGGVIFGVLVIALGCVGAALRLTTDVALTPTEISYRTNFLRRTVPWISVESFRVGRASGWGSWSCVVVEVRQRGSVRIPIAGSRDYVERVLGELEAYRAGLGTAGVTKG
jgi:hypothetical protein